jgi:leucyl aminopeptidase
MKITIQTKVTKNDLLIIPFYEGKNPKPTQEEALTHQHQPDFEGKLSETVMVYQKDKITPRLLLVGLGPQKKETEETWRRAGGAGSSRLKKAIQELAIIAPKESPELITAFVEGILLGHYQYEEIFTDKSRRLQKLKSLQIIVTDKKLHKKLNDAVLEVVEKVIAVHLVRDLVNAPSNYMSPTLMAKKAQEIAKKSRAMSCKVYGESWIKKMKMGCLLGVGQGAAEESKFIVLEHKYKPKNKKPIVLIGKGVCFDAGGINIKTRELPEMKFDMAGAATVLGIFQLLAKYKLPLYVIGITPCAENLLGAKAIKPGDILTAYDGTTVEIKNTDAEGRLILGDAIAYANKKYKPETIIDIATLTGAAIAALGYDISALVSNNNDLTKKLQQAALETGEKVWELPLDPDYKSKIKGVAADIDNYTASTSAGTIMGGAFLEHFVKKTPWAHLDMGGSGWANEAKPYIPKGATGRLVRTLWEFLKNV